MIRLAIRVPAGQAEVVLAELLELSPSGVEEARPDEQTVEYAIYGPPGELPGLPDLHALAAGQVVEISSSEVADDWQERWRDFHRPIVVPAPRGPRPQPGLRVRPPWEPALGAEEAELLELVIDPAQAFGTGAHATTRLCLEMLLGLLGAEPAGAAIDIGTGSGVLAIAAARLGLSPVLALDNDPESIRATRLNAAVNGVAPDIRRLDLRREPLPWLGAGRHDGDPAAQDTIALANLLRPLLIALAEAIRTPPRHLIASGLLIAELDEIAELFAERHGLREQRRATSGEWGALVLSAGG